VDTLRGDSVNKNPLDGLKTSSLAPLPVSKSNIEQMVVDVMQKVDRLEIHCLKIENLLREVYEDGLKTNMKRWRVETAEALHTEYIR